MGDQVRPPKPQKPPKPKLERPAKPKPALKSSSSSDNVPPITLGDPFEAAPSSVSPRKLPPRPPLSRTASPMPDLSNRPTSLPQPPTPVPLDCASPMQPVGHKSVEWQPPSEPAEPVEASDADRPPPLPKRNEPTLLKPPSMVNVPSRLVGSSHISHSPPTCDIKLPCTSAKTLFSLKESILVATAQGITLLGEGLVPVWDLTLAGVTACCLMDGFLWFGTAVGQVGCIDYAAGTLVFQRAAHNGAVKHMWDRASKVLTLGVDGKLMSWNKAGDSPKISRVTLTAVSSATSTGGGHIYCTTKNSLHCFSTASNQVVRSQRWPTMGTKGDYSAIVSDASRLYCGHNDGTLSVYDLECEGQFSTTLSIHGITCLYISGNTLWVGLSTGTVLWVDVAELRIAREWKACEGPVYDIVEIEDHISTVGTSAGASTGASGGCAVWDPRFRDVQKSRAAVSDLSMTILSWNVDSRNPETMAPELIRNNCSGTELVVFGLQEVVELGNKTKTAKNLAGDQVQEYGAWRNFLMRSLGSDYEFISDKPLVGLYLAVFAKPGVAVSWQSSTLVKTGMGGLHGNKGAVVHTFNVEDTSVCLINCHLAAGHTEIIQRNRDAAQILATPVRGSMRPADFDLCFFFGDTNYRINTAREAAVKHIKDANWARLEALDQLNGQKRKNPGFCLNSFLEEPIQFPPTYKFDRGSDTYDSSSKKRVPAWCDRILFKGAVRVLQYDSLRTQYSDHRPVVGKFVLG